MTFVFGHLGFPLLVAELAGRRFPAVLRLPTGWLLLGALLPDFVDKPLAFTVLPDRGTHLVAHTGLFLVLVGAGAASLARRRAAAAPAAGAMTVGVLTHLVLDLSWTRPAEVLFPLFGWPFAGTKTSPEGYLDERLLYLGDPVWVAVEAAGAVALALGATLRRRRARVQGAAESF